MLMQIKKTRFNLKPDMNICQSDYPLDWYQEEFIPYAEEYIALPDRKPATIISWMRKYIEPAQKYFGDTLLLLAHYYMGGEIVKLVEIFGGEVADSYQLALKAINNPNKKIIIESAVHFMAEAVAILADASQKVYITNPKAGCTMEMYAKEHMVLPALNFLNNNFGKENILPICYMNTSGKVKALAGAQGGAVCTSSNVEKIFAWAIKQNKKIIFIPDQHMGENVCGRLKIPKEKIAYWPCGEMAVKFSDKSPQQIKEFNKANVVLFSSYCSVHTYFSPEMVNYWHERNFTVVVHPECRKVVTDITDAQGSTAFIWDYIINDRAKTKKYAIGTENHMVENLKQAAITKGIEVVNLAEITFGKTNFKMHGCGCATMARNDPPHLVALLDLLRQGKMLEYNLVKPGDTVNEFTGARERLPTEGQNWICENAKIALQNMIKITQEIDFVPNLKECDKIK